MSQASDVKAAFPDASYGPPCTEAQIQTAELKLGHALPSGLIELYRAFDGFRGPTNSQFFFPLIEPPDEMSESLVGHTLFLRGEDYFPEFVKRAVAFGGDGTGSCWLILLDEPNRVVLWDAEWGDDYEPLEGAVADIWRNCKLQYDALSDDRDT